MNHSCIRNPALYESVRQWCQDALALLRSHIEEGEKIPRTQRLGYKVEWHEMSETVRDASTRETKTEVLSIEPLVNQKYYEELMQLNTFRRAVEVMREIPEIARHLDVEVGTKLGTHMIRDRWMLNHFVKIYWNRTQSLEFDEVAYQHVYDLFENFFYAQHFHTEVLVPLDNFACTVSEDCVDLGGGLAIRRLCDKTLQEMYADEWVFRETYKERLTDVPNWAIVLQREEPKIVGQRCYQYEEVVKLVNDVVSALRIYKSGFVTYQIIRVRGGPNEWGLGPSYLFEQQPRRFRPLYELDADDTDQLKALWQAYQTVAWDTHKFLKVAVDRLNFGADRSRPEDRLVDYVVSLEALFGEAEEKGEIGFRLALRGAKFLGSDVEDRVLIYRDLKAAYRVRSDIVHGKPNPKVPKGGNIEDFVDRTEGYVRRTLQKFTDLGKGAVRNKLVDWDNLLLQ